MNQTTKHKIMIFGSNSAIAKELARQYAKDGNLFFLWARNEKSLEAQAADLKIRGSGQVFTHSLDLDFISENSELLQNKIREFNPDRVLIAHGLLGPAYEAQLDLQAIEKIIRSNFISQAQILTLLAMNLKSDSTIGVISSVAGDRGRMSSYIYGSAKAGISCFVSGLRMALNKKDIHLLDIKPGPVDTPMTTAFKKGPLWGDPVGVGIAIYHAMESKKDVLYTPSIWRLIMFIICLIPSRIFKRLRF